MMIGARTGAWAKSGSPTPSAYGGLCFTAEADNSSVQLTAVGSAPAVTLVKSFDGVNWEDYAVGEVIDLPSVGDFVYLAAGEGGNNTFGSSVRKYHKFVIKGRISATGDITSIRRADLEQTTLATYCYYSMFRGCTGLTSAPELPATTLVDNGYASMFNGCTGLTSAPELPATTLARRCYQYMFRGCTGLTIAPELPATTLAVGCYQNMFYGCTGLTSAPELPATTLADGCYQYMFRGCTGLTIAPELPATTLVGSSYYSMFEGCTNLSLIKVRLTAWGEGQTTSWVSGVSQTGTFYKPSALPAEYGTARIPTGWTVVNID